MMKFTVFYKIKTLTNQSPNQSLNLEDKPAIFKQNSFLIVVIVRRLKLLGSPSSALHYCHRFHIIISVWHPYHLKRTTGANRRCSSSMVVDRWWYHQMARLQFARAATLSTSLTRLMAPLNLQSKGIRILSRRWLLAPMINCFSLLVIVVKSKCGMHPT